MANRFWVGLTASWNGTALLKWSTTSGGIGGAAEPTAADDVFFDAASGAGTVTIDVSTRPCLSLNFTGYTGTITDNGFGLNISGSLTLSPTMTNNIGFPGGPGITFIATAGTQTITSNGKAFVSNCTININGPGGTFQLADTLSGAGLLIAAGTFNANSQNMSLVVFATQGVGTKVINMSSGTCTITGAAPLTWDLSITAGLTFNAQTSTIKFTNTSATNIPFVGGSQIYNNVWFARGTSTASNTITGSNTFADLRDDGIVAHSLIFGTGTTQTVTTFTVNGSSTGNRITINSDSTGTHNLVKAGGGTIIRNFLNIQHSIATPSNTWYALNSVNNQAVATAGSGWIFNSFVFPDQIVNTNNQVQAIINNNTAGYVPYTGATANTDLGIQNLFTLGAIGVGTISPVGKLHVVQEILGNEVQRLESVATNDDPSERVFQNRVQTTTAVATTLHSFVIPTNTVMQIKTWVVARRTVGVTVGDGAGYEILATYRNVAGVVTLIGAITRTIDEDQATWNATYAISAQSVLLQVTGVAASTIVWHNTSRTYQVAT